MKITLSQGQLEQFFRLYREYEPTVVWITQAEAYARASVTHYGEDGYIRNTMLEIPEDAK